MVKGPGDEFIWLFFHEQMVMWDKAIKHFKRLACLAQAPHQSHWFKGSYISFSNLTNIMFADEKKMALQLNHLQIKQTSLSQQVLKYL